MSLVLNNRAQVSHYQGQQLGIVSNPIALRMAKTLWSFDRSECNRVNDPAKQYTVS